MFIGDNWRILTVGDGDLSFSYSLLKHFEPAKLTATIFDDKNSLTNKYGDDYYQLLQQKNCQIITGFDVTKPNTWQNLVRQQYDLVIFQFPLVPAFNSVDDYLQQCQKISINTINRRLLRRFLLNSFEHFLDPNGHQLAYITSKDVKPYRQWNIETALTINSNIIYAGASEFNIKKFPGYKIRNVDRDKHVRDTQGLTYVFTSSYTSLKATEFSNILQNTIVPSDTHCRLCRVGPFMNETDKHAHHASKKHQQMLIFEQQWLFDLTHLSSDS